MRIRTACLEGRQAYWVCPLIDESEEMPYQAAEETAAALACGAAGTAMSDWFTAACRPAKEQRMQPLQGGRRFSYWSRPR